MSTIDLEMLRNWGRVWEHPELWSALCRGERSLGEDQLARALVRRAAYPATAMEVFEELLDMGEIDAAAALLDLPGFRRAVSDAEALLDRVAASQEERLRAFNRRAAALQLRAARVGVPPAKLLQELEAARALCVRRGAAADEVLRAIDHVLSEREAETAVALPATPALGAPQAPRWPFSEQPVECCRWFLISAGLLDGHVPAGFDERWAAQDEASLALATAMLPVLMDTVSATAVAAFAGELERFLGCAAPLAEPRVTEQEDGFVTVLRGLPTFKLPALLPELFSDGVPLIVPKSSRSRVSYSASLSILFCPESLPAPEWTLRLEPQHLFPLMRHGQHRALQVIRALAAQIPPARILPPMQASAGLLFGRERELRLLEEAEGLVVVLGATGMGKTSLLLEHSRRMGGAVEIHDGLHGHPDAAGRLRALLTGGGRRVASCTPAEWQELSRALGRPPPTIALLPLRLEDVRSHLQDLFEFMDIRLDPPQLLDRLLWCSGGHPKLVWMLLQALWDHQAGRTARRRVPILEEDVESAWCSPVYRSTAVELLLQPLAKRPLYLRVLYQLLELSSTSFWPDQALDEATFVGLFAGDVGSTDVLVTMEVLQASGLIERDSGPDLAPSVRPSNLGTLVNYLVSNLERLLRELLEGSPATAPPL